MEELLNTTIALRRIMLCTDRAEDKLILRKALTVLESRLRSDYERSLRVRPRAKKVVKASLVQRDIRDNKRQRVQVLVAAYFRTTETK